MMHNRQPVSVYTAVRRSGDSELQSSFCRRFAAKAIAVYHRTVGLHPRLRATTATQFAADGSYPNICIFRESLP